MAINFQCSSCGRPYSVGDQNAGRAFNCKGCGTPLTVPQAPEVHMDGGAEVMRSPSSRRRAAALPQKLLREPPPPQPKKSAMPIIVGVVVVVLIAGGVAAFLALSPGKRAAGNTPVALTNEPRDNSAQTREPTEREKLLEKLNGRPGTEDLMTLLGEAESLGLEPADCRRIAIRCVDALCFSRGEGYTDGQIMQFAQKVADLQAHGEPERLYRLVVDRRRAGEEPTEAYLEARKRLGQYFVEIDPQLERAAELDAYGVLKGVQVYITELEAIREDSDEGWVNQQLRDDFENIVVALDKLEFEIEELRRTDPFVFRAAESRRKFFAEKWGQRGSWIVEHRKPFVVFCQQKSGEREDEARERVKATLDLLEQYREFFREAFAEPMNLVRELPRDVPQEEREQAPVELLMFRDSSHWRAYLRDQGIDRLVKDTVGYEVGRYIEAGSGRASIPVEGDFDERMTGLTIEWLMFLHHPHSPESNPEDQRWHAYGRYFIWKHFEGALRNIEVTRGRNGNSYRFFVEDTQVQRVLQQWLKPRQITDRGVASFGGSSLKAVDIVRISGLTNMQPVIQQNLVDQGWTQEDADKWITLGQTTGMYHYYARGFINFLYYWTPEGGKPRYRAQFLKFLEQDIRHVSPNSFEEVFELEDGWEDFEADWLLYQQGE